MFLTLKMCQQIFDRVLNIASDIKYTSVLNILGYSYNNIINIANVIILEFLFARFVHPSYLQLTIFFNTS